MQAILYPTRFNDDSRQGGVCLRPVIVLMILSLFAQPSIAVGEYASDVGKARVLPYTMPPSGLIGVEASMSVAIYRDAYCIMASRRGDRCAGERIAAGARATGKTDSKLDGKQLFPRVSHVFVKCDTATAEHTQEAHIKKLGLIETFSAVSEMTTKPDEKEKKKARATGCF